MTANEFETQVRAAFEGTPYLVTRTPSGFEVTLDVANAQWYGLFNKAGLRYVFTHEVKVADTWFAITDVERELRWSAGVPRIVGSGSTRDPSPWRGGKRASHLIEPWLPVMQEGW